MVTDLINIPSTTQVFTATGLWSSGLFNEAFPIALIGVGLLVAGIVVGFIVASIIGAFQSFTGRFFHERDKFNS